MRIITLIDDSEMQMSQIAMLIEETLSNEEVEINKYMSFNEVQEHLEDIFKSDYIFCDFHFKDTSYTGEDILNTISRLDEIKAKMFILTGDTMAISHHEDAFEYISKLNLFNESFLDDIFYGID